MFQFFYIVVYWYGKGCYVFYCIYGCIVYILYFVIYFDVFFFQYELFFKKVYVGVYIDVYNYNVCVYLIFVFQYDCSYLVYCKIL